MIDLDDLSRADLATLVREHLLAGHLIDRAGMPHVLSALGVDGMRDVAVDEWMGASPLYTTRMQRLLGYEGDDVETIFKGLQLDVGSPPQYMDFRFRVDDRSHGEFWLDSCGALLDVEPMGEELVVTMCHAIEDPTFDATAVATNPRARMRPVHRPPRHPADRHPHCHWTVTIDPDEPPLPRPAVTDRLAETLAAQLELPVVGDDGEGWSDYTRPLEDDLDLDGASRGALLAVSDEVCLQGHLLAMSFLAAVEARLGADVAVDIGRRQLTGVAGVVAGRLKQAFGLGDGLDAIASVLELHPAFRPRSYVALRLHVDGGLVVEVPDAPGRREPREHSWPSLLDTAGDGVLDAIARAVDARATSQRLADDGDTWRWGIELADEPAPVASEVVLTGISTGADFTFARR